MPFAAILGAGPLGGTLTHTLSSRALFDEVRLVDPAGDVAAGKALDIRQAGPPDGVSTRVTGHADVAAAAGAWVLALADPIPRETAADAVALIRRAVAVAPGALLVCAAYEHASLLHRLVGEGVIAPDLVVGSAPSAVAAAARALVAAHVDRSFHDIVVTVTDEPHLPGRIRVDWACSSIAGRAAEAVLPREHRARLDDRLARSLPPGPMALASAAARFVEAAWFGSRAHQPAWVVDTALVGSPPPARQPVARVVSVRFAPGGRLERMRHPLNGP
jgi:hypothetical protein